MLRALGTWVSTAAILSAISAFAVGCGAPDPAAGPTLAERRATPDRSEGEAIEEETRSGETELAAEDSASSDPPADPAPSDPAAEPAKCNDKMMAEQKLLPGESRRSCNGMADVVYQPDGNLVVYGPSGALWQSHTHGKATGEAWMQSDGNFVVYGAPVSYTPDEALWSSKTAGNPGAYLKIADDCRLVIYGPGDVQLWATDTTCDAAAPDV